MTINEKERLINNGEKLYKDISVCMAGWRDLFIVIHPP